MPVTYETPSPVAAFGYLAQQQQEIANRNRNAQLAAAASQGGYGRGGSDNVPYDTGIQQAIFGRDQMQFAQEKDSLDRQAAFGLQDQHFQLQSQLSQTQLTQQENLRLQRMKNAIGDVQNDSTLSDGEKADMVMQLKTGISPLAQRDAAAKVQAQQHANEAMVEQRRAQTALQLEETRVTSLTADQRKSFLPDDQELAKISEDISQNADLPPMLPQQRDAFIAKLAHDEALKQGLGTTMFQKGYKDWIPLKGAGAEAAAGHGKGMTDHPSGLDPQAYLKAREQAEAQAHKEQTLTSQDNIGNKVNVHPQSIEWKNERVQQIMKSMGLPGDMQEYMKQSPQKKSGYNSSLAHWNRGKQPAAAATASTESQKPFEFQDEKTQTPEQKTIVSQMSSQEKQISDSKGPPELRQSAMEAHGQVKMMLMKYGSYQNMPDSEKAKFKQLAELMAQAIQAQPQPSSPQPAAAATDQNMANVPVGGTSIEGGGRAPTPAEAVGNMFRYGRNQISGLPGAIQSANPFRRKRAGER